MFNADLQNDTLFLSSEGKSAINFWRCAYKSALSSCMVCAIY